MTDLDAMALITSAIRSGNLQMMLSASDKLHSAEVSGACFNNVVESAWLRLQQAIDRSRNGGRS